MSKNLKNFIKILKSDGFGVMPTDTLYGLVASAFSPKAISRIYKIKNRDKKKKLIVLIADLRDLKKFNVKLTKEQKEVLQKVWPGKTSVILNNTAFRLPKNKKLVEILKKTGPLVAPSANPESLKPARNITEARKYFGDQVDFYLSGGTLSGKASKLIKLEKNGKIEILR
jgi:L-threonylcarbamoyladenylate synthase